MSEEGDFIRGALQKLLPRLKQTIDLKGLGEDLFTNAVINPQQWTKLKEEKWEPLLEMVIEKEIEVDGFMEVMKSYYQQKHQAIQEAVHKFRTGEWNLPGKLDIESEFLQNTFKPLSCRPLINHPYQFSKVSYVPTFWRTLQVNCKCIFSYYNLLIIH